MPYTPVTFVDGVTPLNAANMNKLEDGVEATTAVADAAVPKALVDAKGDILAASAADTIVRVPVGTNGQALLADSAQASGLKWGVAGAALTYEGDHVPATTYDDGDVVVKDGIAYLCVGGPTTVAPDPLPWGLATALASYGLSLPASPVDGQEHTLVPSLTNPTWQWRFRYNAGSTSAYKWEFVGGVPVTATYLSVQPIVSAGTWTPGMPQIITPRAGEYRASYSVAALGGSLAQYMSAMYSNSLIVDNSDTGVYSDVPSAVVGMSVNNLPLTLTAGQAIQLTYWTTLASAQVGNRTLSLLPSRVS